MRISEWPTPECQLSAYPRHILTPRCLVGDAHDDFADVGIGWRQPAFILQLRRDSGDFLRSKSAGEEREQREVVALGNSVRVTGAQPVDDGGQK